MPTLKEIFDGYMAAYAGFEPTNAGVKFLCLTAWLYPYVNYLISMIYVIESLPRSRRSTELFAQIIL